MQNRFTEEQIVGILKAAEASNTQRDTDIANRRIDELMRERK